MPVLVPFLNKYLLLQVEGHIRVEVGDLAKLQEINYLVITIGCKESTTLTKGDFPHPRFHNEKRTHKPNL